MTPAFATDYFPQNPDMTERLTPPEINANLPAIIAAMKLRTEPHLCAIYGVFDENFGELVGSSTLLSLRGETFLLTADHVARAKLLPDSSGRGLRYVGIAHTARNGEPPCLISAPIYGMSDPYDLALIPVDVTTLDRVPLDAGLLATNSNLANRDILFIQGLPGARSHSLFGVHSDTLPYATGPGTSTFAWFDPKIHFAIDYSKNGLLDEKGEAIDMVNPHGLSGSAVWATGRCTTGDAWDSSLARVVGVIHNWDEQSQSLVGTRIEAVREFVLHVVRSRHAYSEWEQRGRPVGDDWTDWLSAVQAIPGL